MLVSIVLAFGIVHATVGLPDNSGDDDCPEFEDMVCQADPAISPEIFGVVLLATGIFLGSRRLFQAVYSSLTEAVS